MRAAQLFSLRVDRDPAVRHRNAAAPCGLPPAASVGAMVSRVTTALLLALAASTEAAASAPRRVLTTSGLGGESDAAPQDAARKLATAAGEVAPLTAAAPRRELAEAAASRVANATTAAGFVHAAGATFELAGKPFIAVGANQCARPPARPAGNGSARTCGGGIRHAGLSQLMTRPAAMRRSAASLRTACGSFWAPGARAASAQPLASAARPLVGAAVAPPPWHVPVLTPRHADALMMTATWDWDGVEMLLDQAASQRCSHVSQ